jgi:hypothetical protein
MTLTSIWIKGSYLPKPAMKNKESRLKRDSFIIFFSTLSNNLFYSTH